MAEEGKKRSVRRRNPSVNLDTLGLEMGNIPPQALDVEEAVLGALLIEPHCVDEAMDELSPSCFYSEKHRMIFEAMSMKKLLFIMNPFAGQKKASKVFINSSINE